MNYSIDVPVRTLFNMNNPPASVLARIRRSKDVCTLRDAAYYSALLHFRRDRIALPLVRCRVQVMLPVPDGRLRDPHNYEPTVKPIVDGLVQAGVWPDDSPQWVEMLGSKLYVNRAGLGIVLIEEVEGD